MGSEKCPGQNALGFPKLPEFQQLTLKALCYEERNKGLVIKQADIVP
jgi:hypothetical protein